MQPQVRQAELPGIWKKCNKCGGKNHFKSVCKSSGSESKCDSQRPDGVNRKNRCLHRCNIHEIHEDEFHDDSSMKDLNEQV